MLLLCLKSFGRSLIVNIYPLHGLKLSWIRGYRRWIGSVSHPDREKESELLTKIEVHVAVLVANGINAEKRMM